MGDLLDDQLAQLEAISTQRATLQPPQTRPFSQPAGVPAVVAQAAQTPPPQPPRSLLDRAGDFLKGAVSKANEAESSVENATGGALAGIVRAPGQLLGGLLDTTADAGRFTGDNIDAAFARGSQLNTTLKAATYLSPVGALSAAAQVAQGIARQRGGSSLADVLSARKTLGQIGSPGVNQFTAEATGIAASLPFGGEGAAPEAAGVLSKIAKGAGDLLVNSAKVGGATAIVTDPRAARISNLIQAAGVHNAVIDYLAGDDSDPDLVKRFKSGVEGAIGNAALEPIFTGLGSALKAALKGDAEGVAAGFSHLPQTPEPTVSEATPLEGAAEHLDRTFATGRTQEARYRQAEAENVNSAAQGELRSPAESQGDTDPRNISGAVPEAPQGQAPTASAEAASPETTTSAAQGTRHTDSPPSPSADEQVKVATDANALLEKAGVSERLDPETMQVASDGRIVVDPKTKAALDEQGLGRAFAAADESAPDVKLFKETDAEGGARVVGALDREGVQAFASRVATLRDAAEEAGDQGVLDVRHGSADALGTAETAGRSGEWKVANLGAPYDVAPTIRALIDQVPQRARPKSDAALMADAKAAYDAVGIAPQDALEYASKIAGQSRDLDTALVVVRTLWADAARALDDLTGLDVSTFSDEAVKDAAARIHHAMMLSLDMADTKAGLGRAMRAQQLPDLTTYLENFGKVPEEQLAPKGVGELPPLPRTPDELQQWLDLWGSMKDDPVARQRFLQGLTFVPGKWTVLRNSFPNFFTASLVSAPSTFARDLAGPAIVGGLRTIERTAGGYAASLNPFISQATRTELLATASQAPAAYVRTLADIGDAFRYALQAVKQGRGVLGGPNPVDFSSTARIPQPLIDAAMAKTGPGVTGEIPYVLGNLINAWPRAVHALHGGVNEFAQRLAYNGEIRAQAMLEAAQLGLSDPQDVRRFVLDKLDSAGDPLTGAATNETALASSKRTTFTQDVGGGDITRGFAKWIADAKTNVPELNYILPIFRVPANALGETVRRIPFVGQMLQETRDELAGKLGAGAQAEAYGRFLSGAALMGAGFVMARNGTLTGAGPQEPAARALWLQTHEPYSIRLGDKWVGFNRLDVVGQMLGIAGSTYDRSVYRAADNGNAIFAGVGAFAQYFKDQAALQGLANLLSFGGSPNESQGFLARLTQGIASGFVPNFLTQLGRNNLDPTARIVHGETLDTSLDQGVIPALGGAAHSLASGAWQAILNKVPGGSTLLDPQRNFLGEETYKVQGAGFNSLPISLSNVNTYAKDPVLDELARLYEQTGYAPGVLSPAAGKGHFDTRDVKLEDGHSLYDALLRHRMTVEVNGQTLRAALTDAITSPEYADAVDGTGRRETDAGQTTRAGIIGKIFADYSKAAKQATAGESPVAARWLAVADAKDQDNAALRPYSAQDLVRQPALLRALNIPIEEHEDKVRGDYEPAQ